MAQESVPIQSSLWHQVQGHVSWNVPYLFSEIYNIDHAPVYHQKLIKEFEGLITDKKLQGKVYGAVKDRIQKNKDATQAGKIQLYDYVISLVQLLYFLYSTKCLKNDEQKRQIIKFWRNVDEQTLKRITKRIELDFTWIYADDFIDMLEEEAQHHASTGSKRVRHSPEIKHQISFSSRARHELNSPHASSVAKTEVRKIVGGQAEHMPVNTQKAGDLTHRDAAQHNGDTTESDSD